MAFKIIVCAKQVPDTNVIKINPKTGTLIRDGVPSILNHDDANALEEALKIKDKYDDVTITVVSMGLRLLTFCLNVLQKVLTKVFWFPTEQLAVPIHGLLPTRWKLQSKNGKKKTVLLT